MRISGSHQEVSFLLRIATQMQGEYLYFGPGGDFWMIYDKGRVAYVKTKLDISHHMVLSKSAFLNINNTLYRIRKHEQLAEYEEYDWGTDYVRIDESTIQVGSDPESKVTMHTNLERVPMFSPLVQKLEKMRVTAEPVGTPHLKIDVKLLKRYAADMRKYFRQYREGWTFSGDFFRENDDETMNVFSVEPDGELGVIRKPPRNLDAPVTKFRYRTGWFIPERDYDYLFYLSDTDLRLMILAGRYESISDFRILLFKEHYVIDSHESDLRFKMWLNRDKSMVPKVLL